MFYKLYKHYESSSEPWWSDWKAGASMGALEIWLLLSIGAYYSILTKTSIELSISMPIIYIPLLVIFILNYFSFMYNDIWKEYNKEFNQLPKKKNILGGWIVFGIIVFVIGNMLFSFYLLFVQAKKDQTGLYAPEIVAKERKEDSLQKAQQIEKLKKIYGEDKK